jgi:hypothetical protein
VTRLAIGVIVGFLLGSATAGVACGMWKITIEDNVYLSSGKTISVHVHGVDPRRVPSDAEVLRDVRVTPSPTV